MKHPFAWLVFIFSLGILAASLFRVSFETVYLLAAAFLTFCLVFSRRKLIFVLCLSCAVFFFGALSLKNSRILPKEHISRFIYYQSDNFFCLEGLIDNQPALVDNKTTFIFKIRKLYSKNAQFSCCGKALVYVKGITGLAYGDVLLLKGKLFRPYNFGANQRRGFRDYLYNQGIYAFVRVRSASEIITLERNKGLGLKRFSLRLKSKIEAIIFKQVSVLTAAVLDAMLLGEKKFIPPLIYKSMMQTGTVHILVVSGFNTGIVAFIIFLILKLLRLKRKIRFILALPCLVIYCFATGASTPVVRATIMTIIFAAGFLVKREAQIYNSLAIAALSILLGNPRQIFDIGFQLSFSSVFAIAYLYPKLSGFLQTEKLKIRLLKLLLEGALVSFSAWVGTCGIIAYQFRMFSPVTVLANILIVPLAGFITLCGFSLVLASLGLPPLAPLFGATAELAVSLLIKLNLLLLKFPGAYFYLH
ncbi:MAG: ComEC/Rec2 family competence protein [Candidatus Omnitrophota bacterium]